MCGRITLDSTVEEISKEYNATFGIEDAAKFHSSFNVAPAQRLCVINDQDGQRKGVMMRFGLIPPFIKNLSDWKATTFNARAETILQKAIYKRPFKKQRCLIIVSGYYEWRDEGEKTKQPYYFFPKEGGTIAIAGIWEKTQIQNADGSLEDLFSSCIITTVPNEITGEYHDRMPVILTRKQDEETWMNPDTTEQELLSLLKPCPEDFLEIRKVNKAVGNTRNDSPRNIEPIDSQEEIAF